MTPELQGLLDQITKALPWLPTVLMWIGGIRLVMKPVNGWAQAKLQRAIDRAKETEDPGDDRIMQRILDSAAYRTLAFLLDMFVSIKLPAASVLKK